jgi:hypothetical protein
VLDVLDVLEVLEGCSRLLSSPPFTVRPDLSSA